uniref:Activator of Hsp90 ATPase AHSA1-like N-terminal domain-containing protein n=1 Tax=Aquila chrysaetos chrysaetos TaxID=223781 RepID=A0A663EHU5_AQUCH
RPRLPPPPPPPPPAGSEERGRGSFWHLLAGSPAGGSGWAAGGGGRCGGPWVVAAAVAAAAAGPGRGQRHGQVGAGGPALDRGGARGRHQRQQLALDGAGRDQLVEEQAEGGAGGAGGGGRGRALRDQRPEARGRRSVLQQPQREAHLLLRVEPAPRLERSLCSLVFIDNSNVALGTVKESGEKHKGSVEIPNLSEENEVDDTEINVSKKKGEGDVLKDLMRTEGTTKVREALRDYLKALKTEFTLGMILPTKATVGQELATERKLSGNTMQDSVSPQSLDIVGVKIPTVKILMREIFNSPADELYSIFTTKELVQKFSKCSAVIEAEKGGKLQMFDGCVSGEYTELVPRQRIVLKWRCRSWPDEHYATVALNFKDMAAQTELQLECKGVPVSNEDSTRQCWKKQYFEEIRILLQQSKDTME